MQSDADPAPIVPRRASTKRQASQPPGSSSSRIATRPAKRARTTNPPAPTPDDEDLAEDNNDDDDEECLLNTVRKKQSAPKRRAAPKRKQKPSAADVADDEDLTAAADEDEKGAGRSFKEGQKNVCPPMGDPQRAFYESLIQEKPTSIIAIKWCVEHGVLIGSQHKLALKYYKALKAAGAFRPGNMGGLKKEFADSFT